jgi:NADH pyrophosphatase NudC (nudix superfamily)
MPPDSPTSPDPLAAASAAPHKRGALRRRLRKLRRARTEQLTALGTLVVDARKRSNGSQPAVVEKRAAEVADLDRQVRDLAHAVDPHADQRELASGIAAGCRECGELLSTDDRFCPACGTSVKPKPTSSESS